MSTPDRGGQWNPRSQEFTPQTSPIKSRHMDDQARYQPPHVREQQVSSDLLVDVDDPQLSKKQTDSSGYDNTKQGKPEDDSDDEEALRQFLYSRAEQKLRKVMGKDRAPSTAKPSPIQAPRLPAGVTPNPSPRRSSEEKYFEGRRLTSSVFSPGYGFRPQGPSEPLPNPEELTGSGWAHHRVYPAPAPIEPAVNQDVGWPTDDDQLPPNPPARPQQQPTTPPAEQYEKNVQQISQNIGRVSIARGDGVLTPPISEKGVSSPTLDAPEARPIETGTPAKTEYVPWDNGVHYENPDLANPFDDENNPYEQRRRERGDAFTNRAPRDTGNSAQRPRDDGYGSQRPRDDGYANQRRGGGGDGAYDSYGSYGEAKRGGEGCFNCGQNGHMSRECPEPQKSRGGSGGCYNCHQEGHMSKDCPEPRSSGGGPGNCFNCGDAGHMSRECPQPRKGGGGAPGNCYSCQEEGHMSRDCPNKSEGFYGGSGGGRHGCFTCGEEGHQSRNCPNPSDCDNYRGSGRGRGDWDQGNTNNTGGGWDQRNQNSTSGWDNGDKAADGWGDGPIAKTAEHDTSSGWGETGAANNDNEWDQPPAQAQNQKDTRPEPSTIRAAPGIHPDRLKMLGGEPRAQPAARDNYSQRAPQGGGDSGWGSRQNNAPARDFQAAPRGFPPASRDDPPHMRRAQSPRGPTEHPSELHVEAPDDHDDGAFGGW